MKNKFKLISTLVFVFMFIGALGGCGKKEEAKQENKPIENTKPVTMTKVRLNEVTRSIFYAPMYAAINQGFFKAEGIEIELTTGQGADKTMQQLLSGSADIGFSGPEQVMYIYNQGREDYPVVFAQLTQKDGSFLVSRQSITDFKWDMVKGKTVIGGRPGGVPEMALEYVLKNEGIDKDKDLKLITNIAFNAVPGAFKGGTGDFAAIFEPTASTIATEINGSIAASIGESAGNLPYTCFYTTKSYMDKNKELIEKFTRAIYKGQQWVLSKSDEEVAKAIKEFFPASDEALTIKVIKNYRSIEAYSKTPQVNEKDMNRLMDIIESYNKELLKARPPFDKIVNNEFSDKAIK